MQIFKSNFQQIRTRWKSVNKHPLHFDEYDAHSTEVKLSDENVWFSLISRYNNANSVFISTKSQQFKNKQQKI